MDKRWALPYRPAPDRVFVIAGTPSAVLLIYVLHSAWSGRAHQADPAAATWLSLFSFAFLALTVSLCLALTGAFWRLVSGRSKIIVEPDGLEFHPSVRVGKVRWSDIRGARVMERGESLKTPELQIDFTRHFVGPMNWIPRRRLRIRLPGQAAEAQRILRTIKAKID